MSYHVFEDVVLLPIGVCLLPHQASGQGAEESIAGEVAHPPLEPRL